MLCRNDKTSLSLTVGALPSSPTGHSPRKERANTGVIQPTKPIAVWQLGWQDNIATGKTCDKYKDIYLFAPCHLAATLPRQGASFTLHYDNNVAKIFTRFNWASKRTTCHDSLHCGCCLAVCSCQATATFEICLKLLKTKDINQHWQHWNHEGILNRASGSPACKKYDTLINFTAQQHMFKKFNIWQQQKIFYVKSSLFK